MGLTIKKIAKALKEPGRHFDAAGLYLQVPEPGKRKPREKRASWLLRYELNKICRWMGLGALKNFTLEEARERARRARQLLDDGVDPLAHRKAERAQQALEAAKVMSFEQAARQYFDQHAAAWKNAKHRNQFLSSLQTYAFPKIGRLSVSDIDTGLCLKVLEPIWADKTVTASRVRSRIESVLDWATVRGYRTGDNPARWRGHLSEVLPARAQLEKNAHHAALPFAELPEFMVTLGTHQGVGARALEFLILTAARTGEVIGATWEEIDFKAKTWTVPAGRMKGKREHRVPLSDRALEILQALPTEKGNPNLFIGSRNASISDTVMAGVIQRCRTDITVHGFRSTFRDWAAERTNYPNHVVEMGLAHAIGNAVERAYRRGDLFDKRVKLMADWARYCTTKPAETVATETVVPLRRA